MAELNVQKDGIDSQGVGSQFISHLMGVPLVWRAEHLSHFGSPHADQRPTLVQSVSLPIAGAWMPVSSVPSTLVEPVARAVNSGDGGVVVARGGRKRDAGHRRSNCKDGNDRAYDARSQHVER